MLTLLGTGLIVIALRDVTHELFHPELSGSLSRLIVRALWRVMRLIDRVHHGAIHHAGPTLLVAVGASWAALIAFGSALVYLPRLPHEFDIPSSLPAAASSGFGTALYLSLAYMTSVGSTGLTPIGAGARVITTAEPLLGLVLISAWISWVLSIYPIIAERRVFERELELLQRAARHPADLLTETPREAVSELLRDLTTQVVRVGTQLNQAHITYYFQNESASLALTAQLPYLRTLAHEAEKSDHEPLIRHYGVRLRVAIDDLLRDIVWQHLRMRDASPQKALDAIAADHRLPTPIRAH